MADEIRADEACATGDQQFHLKPPLAARGRQIPIVFPGSVPARISQRVIREFLHGMSRIGERLAS